MNPVSVHQCLFICFVCFLTFHIYNPNTQKLVFNDTVESLKHTLHKHMNFPSWADALTRILRKARLENLLCKMVSPQVSMHHACCCRKQGTNTCMEIFFTSQIFPLKNNYFLPVKISLSSLYKPKVRRKMLCFFTKLRK